MNQQIRIGKQKIEPILAMMRQLCPQYYKKKINLGNFAWKRKDKEKKDF